MAPEGPPDWREAAPGKPAASAGTVSPPPIRKAGSPAEGQDYAPVLEAGELAKLDLPRIAELYAGVREKAQGDAGSRFAPVAEQLDGEISRRLENTSNELITDDVGRMLSLPNLPESIYSLAVDFLAANKGAKHLLDSLFIRHLPAAVRESAEEKFNSIAREYAFRGWLTSLSRLLPNARGKPDYHAKCGLVCPHISSLLRRCADKREKGPLERVAFRMKHLPDALSGEAMELLTEKFGEEPVLTRSYIPIYLGNELSEEGAAALPGSAKGPKDGMPHGKENPFKKKAHDNGPAGAGKKPLIYPKRPTPLRPGAKPPRIPLPVSGQKGGGGKR